MRARISLNPESEQSEGASYWAAFSDITLAMLLVFLLFILAQILQNQEIFVLEAISQRKQEVAASVASATTEADSVEVLSPAYNREQRIRVGGAFVFKECSEELEETGQDLLRELGAVLDSHRTYFTSVEIEGHADRQAPTGPVCKRRGISDNWQLSARRANQVVRFFSQQELIGDPKLSSVGKGQFHPLSAPEETASAALARDRRIEIVLRYSDDGLSEVRPGG